MEYWQKIDQKPEKDLTWNLPEQKTGTLNIIGGNSQAFNTPIKTSEFASQNTHFKNIKTILPDALQPKLPPMDNVAYLPSTASGSFGDAKSLTDTLNSADANLLISDFSKNTITTKVVLDACAATTKLTLITRDTVDLIASDNPDRLLMNQNLIILGSAIQIQKLFRAVFYPKVFLLSMPIMQIIEALHKFTLSYPVTIVTFHEGQIIIASNGKISSVPSIKTEYSPITIWQGHLATKILDYNFWNPNKLIDATVAAIF